MVVTLNQALGSSRASSYNQGANVAFGNTAKPSTPLVTPEIKHSNKIIDGIAHYGRKVALRTMLTLSALAAVVTGCEKDPPIKPDPPVNKPTTEVFMDYTNAMYGTGSATKSTAGNTALLDSLAFNENGGVVGIKYNYATPDTVKTDVHILQDGNEIFNFKERIWQAADGTLVSEGSDGVILKYTKDVDGRVISTCVGGGPKSKYLPQSADTVLKRDLNVGAESIITILKRVMK